MKYSHIIYNSSEKNQAGAVGLGVRCSTEGSDPQLGDEMQRNEFFDFNYIGKSMSPTQLFENPKLIREIVPTYFFRTLTMPGKKTVYVLGRKIAVGFDYTFYLNGRPGRLGNYVVDCYVFDELPTAREFEILLEDAAAGSNHFIPANPEPLADNEEMKEISLGHKPTLPAGELDFAANGRPAITDRAYDLLFAFIQSRKEGKPVLVKCSAEEAPGLMAQLAALMPQSMIGDLTFTTNHDTEGKKPGINVIFINEHYACEIFRKQWVWLDLTSGAPFETAESALFRKSIKDYVAKNDFTAAHNLVEWCLSDMYEKGKSFSPATQTALYDYAFNIGDFNVELVGSDANLRETLYADFKAHPANAKKLDSLLLERFDTLENLDSMFAWMNLLIAMKPVDCSRVIEETRRMVTCNVFETEDTFRSFYNTFRSDLQEGLVFVDRSAFARHKDYLSSMPEYWEELYRLFRPELSDDKGLLIMTMLDDRVDPKMIERVVSREIPQPLHYINELTGLLQDGGGEHEDTLLTMLERALENPAGVGYLDFVGLFPSKVGDPRYGRLFIWQLENTLPRDLKDVKAAVGMMETLASGPAGSRIMSHGSVSQLLGRILSVLKNGFKKGEISAQDVSSVCERIVGGNYPPAIQGSFELVNDVVMGLGKRPDPRVNRLWEVAVELNAGRYLKAIAPDKFKALEGSAPKEIPGMCEFVLSKGIMSRQGLTDVARKSAKRDAYLYGIMLVDDSKPQEQLDFLCGECGLSDDEALIFLDKYFPKSAQKILKSRQPSIFSKIKNMFGKKEKEGNSESDSDRSDPKNKHH